MKLRHIAQIILIILLLSITAHGEQKISINNSPQPSSNNYTFADLSDPNLSAPASATKLYGLSTLEYTSVLAIDSSNQSSLSLMYKNTTTIQYPISIHIKSDKTKIKSVSKTNTTISKEKITLSNIFGANASLDYLTSESEIKELLTFYSNPFPNASASDHLIITTKIDTNLSLYTKKQKWDGKDKETSEALSFYQNDTPIFKLARPFSLDAIKTYTPINYSLYQKDSFIFIEKVVPMSIFFNQTYPITIDPTIQFFNWGGNVFCYIDSNGPLFEYCGDPTGFVGILSQTEIENRLIVKFNVSMIPTNRTISNATLSFKVAGGGGTWVNDTLLFQLYRLWDNRTDAIKTAVGASGGVTWNRYNDNESLAWNTPGGDYNTSKYSTSAYHFPGGFSGTFTFDVREMVYDARNASENFSIMVKALNTTGNNEHKTLGIYWAQSFLNITFDDNNTAPILPNITISSPSSYKQNNSFFINTTGNITDNESTLVKLNVYYKNGTNNITLLNSSWFSPPNNVSLEITNPWGDGLNHTIYAMVEDNGDSIQTPNTSKTSAEFSVNFTSSIVPPNYISSSVSDTPITLGNSVTIYTNVECMVNCSISYVTVTVTRPSTLSTTYFMTQSNSTEWYKIFTSTAELGQYDITFNATDTSNLSQINNTGLNFTTQLASVQSGSTGSGGGGNDQPNLPQPTAIAMPKIQMKNITDTRNAKDLEEIGACLDNSLMLTTACSTGVINIITNPFNVWVLTGAYLASIIVLFILGVLEQKRRKWGMDMAIYGTITCMLVMGLSVLGFNMFIVNYIFNSSLPGFMTLSFSAWAILVTIIGDNFSYSTRLATQLEKSGRSTTWAWNK